MGTSLLPRRALLAAAGGLLAGGGCRRGAEFKSMDITGATWGRNFALRDADGHERHLADFRGKAVLLFFGFTQCPDVCPTALTRAAEVMRLLNDDGRRLQVIFVTVDPERDTPVVLREYTRAFHPSFVGLYGDALQTATTAREFKVVYVKVPTGASYTMDHTSTSYAFDPQGRLRLAIRHTDTARLVADDVSLLLS